MKTPLGLTSHGFRRWGAFYRLSSRRKTSTAVIPGPKAYPIVGSLPAILSDKDFDKQRLYLYFQKLQRVYGPIVKIEFPGQPPMILVQRPDDVQTLYQLTESNPVRNSMPALKKVKYNDPYFERKGGIVVEDGAEWWRVRSKVQAPVMKPKNVSSYIKHMDKITLDFLERVTRHRDETGEINLDFLEELKMWSLECICMISLNQRIGCFNDEGEISKESQKIMKAAIDYMDAIVSSETGSQLWKLYRTKVLRTMEESLKVLTEVCDQVLQEAEAKLANRRENLSEEELNLMDHLLLNGKGLTRKDIVTFMLDIIPGGTTTISDNVAVILYQLAKNPSAQSELQKELDRVIGEDIGNITAKQLAQLSYTRAVMKEANRIMPPMLGPVRRLQENTQFRGYMLEKGWLVLFTHALLGWEESVYPEVEKFRPERWLRNNPQGKIHPFTNMPFSHGTRMCIGRRIAEQQIYLFLARILHRFNVEWDQPDMIRDFKFVFSPRGPLKFTLNDRR